MLTCLEYIIPIIFIIIPIIIDAIILLYRFKKIPKYNYIYLYPIKSKDDGLTIFAVIVTIYVSITSSGIIGIVVSVMLSIYACYYIFIGKIRIYNNFLVNIHGNIINLSKLKYSIDQTNNQVSFYPENKKKYIMAEFKENDKVKY